MSESMELCFPSTFRTLGAYLRKLDGVVAVAAFSPASHDDIAGLVSKTRQDAAVPLLDGGPDSREVAERESEMLLQERVDLGPVKERAVVFRLH